MLPFLSRAQQSAVCPTRGSEQKIQTAITTGSVTSAACRSARRVGRRRVPHIRMGYRPWWRGGSVGVRRYRRVPRAVRAVSVPEVWWCVGADPVAVKELGRRFPDVLLEVASCLGSWSGKCLHNALLGLVDSSLREFWIREFLVRCANHVGSGEGGSRVALRNLRVAKNVLERAGVCIRVFACRDEAAFEEGRVRGWWLLGVRNNCFLGDLLWCEESAHVNGLPVEIASVLEDALGVQSSTAVAPWEFFNVRGKKATKRGAHLASMNHAKSAAKAKAKSSATVPLPVESCVGAATGVEPSAEVDGVEGDASGSQRAEGYGLARVVVSGVAEGVDTNVPA